MAARDQHERREQNRLRLHGRDHPQQCAGQKRPAGQHQHRVQGGGTGDQRRLSIDQRQKRRRSYGDQGEMSRFDNTKAYDDEGKKSDGAPRHQGPIKRKKSERIKQKQKGWRMNVGTGGSNFPVVRKRKFIKLVDRCPRRIPEDREITRIVRLLHQRQHVRPDIDRQGAESCDRDQSHPGDGR